MRTLYLLSVYVHILSAIVWVGGMLFISLIAVPTIRRMERQHLGARVLRLMARRFRDLGWICIALLIATGIVNLIYRGVTWDAVLSGALWRGTFGRTLGVKLVTVGTIVLLSVLHDFVLGPRLSRLLEDEGRSDRAMRLRKRVSWLSRINVVLALIVVALGVALVRGLP